MNARLYKLGRVLIEDLGILIFSIIVSYILVRTDAIGRILTSTYELEIIGSFIAGMFFTSAFTTAPAIVTLAEIANAGSIWITAFFGAIGAVIVDLIIYKFARDRFSDHIMELIKIEGGLTRFRHIIKHKHFRWITFLIGGIIIASPLPDELGISILGFSKMKSKMFVIFSFVFNFIGILIIGMLGRALF